MEHYLAVFYRQETAVGGHALDAHDRCALVDAKQPGFCARGRPGLDKVERFLRMRIVQLLQRREAIGGEIRVFNCQGW